MNQHGWICLFFLTFAAWGQAQKPATPPAPPKLSSPSPAPPAKAAEPANVSLDTAVITIPGVCEKPPVDKSKSAACETVVTRAEFERLVNTVAPNLAPAARKQLATQYGLALVMVQKAHQMNLDQGPRFQELMRIARIGVLTKEVNQKVQEDAAQVSDQDVDTYYHGHEPAFQEIELQRVFIPRAKQPGENAQNNAQNKDKQNAEDARKNPPEFEAAMKELAEEIRARAAAGEDFAKLQDEAASAADLKSKPPTQLGKVRRSSLPPNQAEVMELKPGGTSQLISTPNGYLIYKVGEKDTLPLEKVHDEIVSTLRSQRVQHAMQAIQKSATPELNEKYFADSPAAAPSGQMAPHAPASGSAGSSEPGPK